MAPRGLLAGTVLALAGLFGCAARPLAPPPAAPAVTVASDFIPPDLDLVARLDFAKVRAVLGAPALSLLAREALVRGGSGDDALLIGSLLQAEVVWLGVRPGSGLVPLDRVLALEGRFEPALPELPPGFSRAVDLGGDVRFWDRKPGGAGGQRAEVARLYAVGDRLRAFVSIAEIDAVERVLSRGGAERRLQPPEQGTLSLSARPQLAARLFGGGALSELLERAERLSLLVELESDAVTFKLVLELSTPAEAERLLLALQDVTAQKLAGSAFEDSAKLSVEEARLTLRARLEQRQLATAVACLREPTASGCAW